MDVRGEFADLRIGDLTAERGHHGPEARHDLRLRVENRLADVVLIDGHLTDVGRLFLRPDPLPGGPDARRARRRVAGEATLGAVEPQTLLGRDVGRTRLALRQVLVALVADALQELLVVLRGLHEGHRMHGPVTRRLAGRIRVSRIVAGLVGELAARARASPT